MSQIVKAALVASLFCASNAFAAGPFGTIHVGVWKGGAYTNDSTGAFSHCAAAAGFANGLGLVLGQFGDHSWSLGFASAAWNLKLGATIPIELVLDGQTRFQVFGKVNNAKLMSAPLPEVAANRLRKSRLLVANSDGETYQFNLGSLHELMSVIANCVDKVRTAGVENAGDFSTWTPKLPTISTAAKSTETESIASAEKPPKLINVNGAGFVISSSGHVVTNYHVISRCVGDVHGNLTGEPTTTLRVVSGDETNDLALLQAAGAFKETAHIRATAVHSGDAVIAIGFPYHGLLTSDFTVTTGIVNSLSGILNDTRFLQISAQIEPGNSGGPLLDTSGDLIGVVAEKLNAVRFAKVMGDIPQNINFAIKTGAVRDFLDNSDVAYQSVEPGAELRTADIAKSARAYTILISCSAKSEESAKK